MPIDDLRKAVHDIDRIKDLPTKPEYDFDALVSKWTAALKLLGANQTLWDMQALALELATWQKGLLAMIPVGGGKTLISMLLPVVLQSARPLLITKAGLLQKTSLEFSEYRKSWKSVPIRAVGYESLGRVTHANYIEEYKPDLIIADEAHKLANYKTSACARRVDKYMRRCPETKFCALSGTMMKRSLTDFAHLSNWALKEGSPLPLLNDEVLRWSLSVDPHNGRTRPKHYPKLDRLRKIGESQKQAVGRRIQETPGVIVQKQSTLSFEDVPIHLQITKVELGPNAKEALDKMKATWVTPNGELITDALELWRHVKEMSAGYYGFWDPIAPEEWLQIRKVWQSFVRETKSRTKRWDSELQIQNAIKNEEIVCDALAPWLEIKKTFTPNPKAKWLDDDQNNPVLQYVADWLRRNSDSGLVWVDHIAVGTKLSEITGVPFYAGGQDDPNTPSINDCKGAAIASISANATGKNLQSKWYSNLVVVPPCTGKTWEQLIGRTHRPGQKNDHVHVEVLTSTEDSCDAFDKAMSEARHIQATFGQQQKLLGAKRND